MIEIINFDRDLSMPRLFLSQKLRTKTNGQAWIVQQGHAFVTSSNREDYDREDLGVGKIRLSVAEMQQLNAQTSGQ
jgi:diketogulonate reductase-like aldo/keto reductase